MKILGVHPGPLMYTKIFLRLEPLGLELVAAVGARRRSRGAADRSAGREPSAIFLRLIDTWRPEVDRLLVQLPREHSGNHRPREGGEGAPAGHFRLRRRAQRIVRRPGDPRAWRRRHRLRAARRGRGRVAAVARRDRERRRPHRYSGRGNGRRARARRPALSIRSTRCCRRATCCAIGANISSACSTRAPRSSSRAAVRGIARSAAPGRSTAAAIGSSARSGSSRICARSASRASSSSTTSRSFTSATGSRLARRSRAPASGRILPRNPRRRAAAQQGGVPLLEEARRRVHVSRARGDRRGGPEEISQARAARAQFRGARIRPLARHPCRDQPDRRSRLGPRAVPRTARMVPRTARDRQYQRQHALSRHRKLADRGAPAADPRLPPVRHPARGVADPAAARRVLRGAGRDTARDLREASGLAQRLGRARHLDPAAAARPDQFRQEPVQAQQRLSPRPAARRPCKAGRV